MSGIVQFKLDCYFPFTGSFEEYYGNYMFKLTWDFFKQLESVGYCTEIARNYGKASTFSPTPLGTGFYLDPTSFGEVSWAVFRMEPSDIRSFPYYIHFQWSANSLQFNTSPGAPGLVNGTQGTTSICFGFSMATAFDSSGNPANPWNGTTGSLGTDTKADPVWAAPIGGTLFIFPRSNNEGNSHATSKQNTLALLQNGQADTYRMNFIADRDNWFISLSDGDSFNADTILGGGFILTPDNIEVEVPLFFFRTTGTDFFNSTFFWGTTTGDGASTDGGASCLRSSGVNRFTFDFESGVDKLGYTYTSSTDYVYGFYPLSITFNYQQIGWADPLFWRIGFNINSRDTDTTMTYMVFRGASDGTIGLVVPWDGQTEIGSTFDRNGVISP
jgi:hypothetical protein